MALRWIDGFETEFDTVEFGRKYAVASASSAWTQPPGFRGGLALSTTSTTAELRTKALMPAVQNTWTTGFRFIGPASMTIGEHPGGMTFFSGAGDQLEFRFNSPTDNTFTIRVYRGATLLGETSRFFAQPWCYIELQSVVRTGVNGSATVKIDGVTVLTIAGANTANAGTDGADRIRLLTCIVNAAASWDDWYIRDDATFLGDIVTQGLFPTSDGNRVQWTPDSGTVHFSRIDDPSGSPNDADKVTSDAVGEVDLYGYGNLTLAGTATPIHGIQVNTVAFMATSGTRSLRPKFRQSTTTEANGATFVVPSTAFNGYSEVFPVDPTDSAAWTKAKVDSMEIGIETVA